MRSVENIYEELPAYKEGDDGDEDGEEEAKYENVVSEARKNNNSFPDVKVSVL